MKFILTENKKFVLDERFVLTEASIADVAKKWTIQLEATLDKTETVLTQYIKYADPEEASSANATKLKELKLKIESAAEELENTLELPLASLVSGEADSEVIKELGVYISALNDVEKVIVKTDDNTDELTLLDKRLKELFTIRSASHPFLGGSKSVENLRKIIKWINEKIIPLFNIDDIAATDTKIKEFKELCEDCLELIKDLRVDLPDDFADIPGEDLKAYCKLMAPALEATQLKVKDINEKKSISPKLAEYTQDVQTLKDAFTKINNSPVLNLDGKQDWKTKYANAVNKETVIKEFIYTTWKNDFDEVLPLSKALLQACEAYGFNTEGENANPFISYISNVYLKYSLNPDLYNIIHNLVANNLLDKKDLMGKGDMGLGNLIFCKALYATGANTIKLYIQKQYKILHTTTVPSEFGSAADLTFNILYKLSNVETGASTKKSNDLSLRSIAEIEDLEEKWLGEVSEVSADDPNTSKTSTAPTADLLKQIDSTENAVKVLATLAIKFSSNDKIVQAVQSCKEAKQLMDTATTLEKIQKLVASVERLYQLTHINATQALNLIKSILESDKFNLTKE